MHRKGKGEKKGWSNLFLSPGGKEVLLKAVVIALPIYTMNCFKLHVGICDEINSIFANYWWHSIKDKKAIHYVSWKDQVYQSEKED